MYTCHISIFAVQITYLTTIILEIVIQNKAESPFKKKGHFKIIR